MTRKILYSPGFGAGWTSWENNEDTKKLMLEYQPLIEALEKEPEKARVTPKLLRDSKKTGPTILGSYDFAKCHPAVFKLAKECQAKFGAVPYMGGLGDLEVRTVSGRVRIEEYDGNESVEEEGEFSGWM